MTHQNRESKLDITHTGKTQLAKGKRRDERNVFDKRMIDWFNVKNVAIYVKAGNKKPNPKPEWFIKILILIQFEIGLLV